MKELILSVKEFFGDLVDMIIIFLFPIIYYAIATVTIMNLLVPSFTNLPDRNIPVDFKSPYELSVLGYYLLAVITFFVMWIVVRNIKYNRNEKLAN
jgi:ABC-type glucose/galactose transport system permease subunit